MTKKRSSFQGPLRWPDFFIIGAAKCGTTTLFSRLKGHPSVFLPQVKEPHYFIDPVPNDSRKRFDRPIENPCAYLRLFERARIDQVTGEASTSYLHHAREAAPRIRSVCPQAKLIALVRDPIERAQSAYLMERRLGLETRTFEQAILDDWNRGKRASGRLWIEMGMYGSQLTAFLDEFPRQNLLLFSSEQFRSQPEEMMAAVTDFLGVARLTSDRNAKERNTYAVPRSPLAARAAMLYTRLPFRESIPSSFRRAARRAILRPEPKPPIDAAVKARLANFYEDEIALTERIAGGPIPELRRSW